MRVALLAPSWPFKGGIARYSTDLFRALRATCDTLFITTRRQYPQWLYPGDGDRAPEDRSLYEADARPLFDPLSPWSWHVSARAIADFQPHTLVLPWWHCYWAPSYLALLHLVRRRSPHTTIVMLCHNVVEHEGAQGLRRRLTRRVLKRADRHLVHGQSQATALRELIGREAAAALEHPAYTADVAASGAGARVQARYGLREPLLLFFGYVRPYKGLDVLLEALAIVRREHPVSLLVAGEVWGDRREWLDRCRSLGLDSCVAFSNGYVNESDIAAIFDAAQLVVLPYRSATGSGVAKLAMSHGKPVLVTRVAGLADAVEDGVSGLLVPPQDPQAMAEAITGFFRGHDGLAMGQAARERARQHDWTAIVDAILEAR
jgi:glycosyltransferase involved in cell wall biosynthesis